MTRALLALAIVFGMSAAFAGDDQTRVAVVVEVIVRKNFDQMMQVFVRDHAADRENVRSVAAILVQNCFVRIDAQPAIDTMKRRHDE